MGLSASDMVIFPNPVNGSSFTVTLPAGFETANASISVEDMLGRQMAVQGITGQQNQLRVALTGALAQGVYVVTLKNETQHVSGRLAAVR